MNKFLRDLFYENNEIDIIAVSFTISLVTMIYVNVQSFIHGLWDPIGYGLATASVMFGYVAAQVSHSRAKSQFEAFEARIKQLESQQ